MWRNGAGRLLALALFAAAAAAAAALQPQGGHVFTGDAGGEGDASPQPWVELLSWRPRVYLYHRFLADEECDHLIKVAMPYIARSAVIKADGSIGEDPIRTSWGTFLTRAQDEVVYAIEHRIANWTHLPVEHAGARRGPQDMQVLRYANNQSYSAHWDDTDEAGGAGLDGTSVRVATVILYLSDAELGGETAFPAAKWLDKGRQAAGQPFSACGQQGVAALARKGNAVLFWDTKLGSIKQDKWALHTGCPVLRGTKWSGVKWIHARPFGGAYPARPLATSGASLAAAERLLAAKQASGELPMPACQDHNAACQDWAARGECHTRAKFMRRECPLSCHECCLPDDILCERERSRVLLRPKL